MVLDVTKVELRIWQSFEKALDDQLAQSYDNQWLVCQVFDLNFTMKKYQYEINILISLCSIMFQETLYVKQPMLINEDGQRMCRIELDIFDLYSPNLKDAEIIVNVELSRLYWLFDSKMINETFKFFRNTQSSEIKDIEKLNVKLMDESEQMINALLQQNDEKKGGKRKDSYQQKHETCKTVNLILVKTKLIAHGITLIAIHHEYYTPLFDLSVGKFVYTYDMYYDHDVMTGEFSNAKMFDLTNYPFTHDPSKTEKASLERCDSFQRYEIIGIRE